MLSLIFNKIRDTWWIYTVCLGFIAANCVCIANEFYWLNLVPAVLLIVVLSIIALDKLVLFCVFLTPLSINLSNNDIHLGLSLPVEPILAGILFLFILRVLYEGKIERRFLRHPVTIAILLNVTWIFITSITSEMPLVSFKFLISRLWFVVPFYFVGVQMFRDFRNVRRFLWLYIIPLTLVIGFTLYIHAQYAFGEDAAHWAMSPFYNDHTAYGAALAMFFPALIAFTFSKEYSNNIRIVAGLLLVIFTIALIFSYTRAAWVSLAGALLLYLVFTFRVRFRWLLMAGAVAGVFLFLSWGDILMKLEQNRQDTSNDLEKHLQSISNISTDASNLERLNRWNSAFRMFNERPMFGWGPGTYSFLYAPFQLSGEKTIISTNAGDLGNAHSEYIGPLCESGVLGTLTFLAVAITIIWTGWRLYYKLPPGHKRGVLVAVILGLFTYLLHGLMNNFLDTDKASIPFWGFAAMLVAADLWYDGKSEDAARKAVKKTVTPEPTAETRRRSRISWIRQVRPSEASGDLKKLYERVSPGKQIDNILSVHSLRPHTLTGHLALYKSVLHHPANVLPKWYLETLGVYTSTLNNCGYCIAHHSEGLKKLISEEKAVAILDAIAIDSPENYFTGKELEGLRYAKMLTQAPQSVEEKDVIRLRNAGLTDGEILEINQVVSYFCYVNRTVLGLGVDLKGDVLGTSPESAEV